MNKSLPASYLQMPARQVLPRAAAESMTTLPVRELALLLAHVPLAILIYRVPAIGFITALAAGVVGIVCALSPGKLAGAAYAVAYIAGAEVLWRMSEVPIFWEYSKYAMVLIAVVALLRIPSVKVGLAPVLYFVLLLPSALLTMANYDASEVRGQLSFNLSGPLALSFGFLLFSNLRFTREQLQNVFLALICPTVGIGIVTLFGVVSATELVFGDESNFATSGGFGPNQVSSALSLGALICFLYLFTIKGRKLLQLAIFVVMIFLIVQSAFTFSRGGLYNAAAGVAVGSFFLLNDARARSRLLIALLVTGILAVVFIVPTLDRITGNAFSNRFQDTSLSGRDKLASIDIDIWLANPVLGVGPGVSKFIHRALHPNSAATHTELTRLLAEHGLLGLISMVMLGVMGWRNLGHAHSLFHKALAASLMCWTVFFMTNSAMRLAAPAFAFGLASVMLAPTVQRLQKSDQRVVARAPRLP